MLATIGYERARVEDVIAALRAAEVRRVIDVRAVAASRRPGFSKRALSAALQDASIDYVHLRALGTPKSGRDAARAGRIAEMRAIFDAHLETPEAVDALAALEALARETPSALLCFEADAGACHRRALAERLAARGVGPTQDLVATPFGGHAAP